MPKNGTPLKRAKLLIALPIVALLGIIYSLLNAAGEYRMVFGEFMEDWKRAWRE